MERKRSKAIARQSGQTHSTTRLIILALPRIPGSVPNEGLVTDVFEALPLQESTLVPLPVVTAPQERPFTDGFAEMHAVITDQQPQVDRAILPILCTVPPSEQPDQYVRVVARSSEGIVVRGAKSHTSVSVNSDELVVLPTRAMKDDAGDFSVAFAVPMDTEGLHLYVSNYGAGDKDQFSFPLSSRYKMLETLTVFDDVFVPWDRVFLDDDPGMAGPVASAFVEFHRFTAVSYKLPLIDAFVGAAAAIAQMNGVPRAAHIREKVTELMRYAETVRSLTELAAYRCDVSRGIARPDPLTTNLAKYTFATGYHQALQLVQDCAGGLLVTGPGGDDWDDPETRAVLERYHSAAVPAEERLRMLNMIADLTVRDFGGYHAVLAVHAEGSIEAEKRHLFQHFPLERTIDYAKRLADPGT